MIIFHFTISIGNPEPEFFWYKDNVSIDEDRHYRIEEDDGESTLIIPDVKVDDRGKYKCVAENIAGKATTTSELFIAGLLYIPISINYFLQCLMGR